MHVKQIVVIDDVAIRPAGNYTADRVEGKTANGRAHMHEFVADVDEVFLGELVTLPGRQCGDELADILVVHGHTPTDDFEPDAQRRRINIDTGACFGGPLTCVALAPGEAPRFLYAA